MRAERLSLDSADRTGADQDCRRAKHADLESEPEMPRDRTRQPRRALALVGGNSPFPPTDHGQWQLRMGLDYDLTARHGCAWVEAWNVLDGETRSAPSVELDGDELLDDVVAMLAALWAHGSPSRVPQGS